MKKLTVEFNLCDSEYMTALRLVTGAVCSAADTDLDTLEDFKVCVTESALILKNGGFEAVKWSAPKFRARAALPARAKTSFPSRLLARS